jgi:hypothetical protein
LNAFITLIHARASTHTHIHTHTRTYAHTHTRTYAHTQTRAHMHTHKHAHTCTHTNTHTHKHAHAHVVSRLTTQACRVCLTLPSLPLAHPLIIQHTLQLIARACLCVGMAMSYRGCQTITTQL